MKVSLLLVLLGLCYIETVRSLKCHEGFSASIMGLPLHHWTERDCNVNSNCFTQEIATQMPRSDSQVTVRYGGCISRAYAQLITCEKLFGKDSDLDPAVVFKMLPGLDEKFKLMATDFEENITKRFRVLFSDGTGTESFIKGCYTFLTNLGFNMTKALSLQNNFVQLMNESLARLENTEQLLPGDSKEPKVDPAVKEFMSTLGKLNTNEPSISSQIYSFMGNFFRSDTVKEVQTSIYSPLISNLPGLIKSTLPESWLADKWFYVFFELLGDINIRQPRTSASNVIYTMKKSARIPEEYSEYLNPIMDNAPDFVENMANGNYYYASHWSVKLLSEESTINTATTRLSIALNKLYFTLAGKAPTGDINLLSTWLPGLSYNLLPGKKSEIDNIYNTIAEGIELMDFTKPNITMKKSNMSDFINLMLVKTRGPLPPTISLIVINLSRVTYTLLESYQEKLDIIFTTLIEGFKGWPEIDLGEITINLITNLGFKVPRPLYPLIDQFQNLILPTFGPNVEMTDAMLEAVHEVIEGYKVEYPNSELPDIAWRIAQYSNMSTREMPHFDCYSTYYMNYTERAQCYEDENEAFRKFTWKMDEITADINVDLQFAIFNEIDSANQQTSRLYEEILKAFPDFQVYIQLMRVLDRQDVKQLFRDYRRWIMNENQRKSGFFGSVVWAFNETVSKITSKFGDFTNELRGRFTPKSCKYDSCATPLCNARSNIKRGPDEEMKTNLVNEKTTKKPEQAEVNSTKTDSSRPNEVVNSGKSKLDPTVEPISTTSSAAIVHASYLFDIVAMVLLLRLM